jgi:hypothetical protein
MNILAPFDREKQEAVYAATQLVKELTYIVVAYVPFEDDVVETASVGTREEFKCFWYDGVIALATRLCAPLRKAPDGPNAVALIPIRRLEGTSTVLRAMAVQLAGHGFRVRIVVGNERRTTATKACLATWPQVEKITVVPQWSSEHRAVPACDVALIDIGNVEKYSPSVPPTMLTIIAQLND